MSHKTCPSCGYHLLDVSRYDSMMVLSAEVAFFTLRCPSCGSLVSTAGHLSRDLRKRAQYAAIEVGAGMGRPDKTEAE